MSERKEKTYFVVDEEGQVGAVRTSQKVRRQDGKFYIGNMLYLFVTSVQKRFDNYLNNKIEEEE